MRWVIGVTWVLCGCGPIVVSPQESGQDDGGGSDTGAVGATTESMTPASTMAGTADEGSGSTTEAPGSCGDGIVDPGEDCDDRGPTEMCNEYCRTPGTLLQEVSLPGCGGVDVEGDPFGDVYVLEWGCVRGAGVTAAQVTKVAPDGSVVWFDSWADATTQSAAPGGLTVTSSGEPIACGRALFTLGGGSETQYAWTRKYDPAGTLLWMDEDFDTMAADKVAWDVATDGADSVFVAGNRLDSALIRKLAADGSVEWGLGQSLDSELSPHVTIATDAAGRSVLGFSRDLRGDWVAALVAYGPGGEILWETAINHSPGARDRPAAIQIGADGAVYVAGEFESPETLDDQAVVTQLSAAGEQEWAWNLDEPSGAADLVVDGGNNVFVAIGVDAGPADQQLMVTRLSPDGEVVWSTRVPTPGSLPSSNHWGIGLDAAENIVVTGPMFPTETWVGWFAR